MSPIEWIGRDRLSVAVAAQLQQILAGGEYQPEEKLPPERILCDQFGVGRSTIREALRLLEAEGFVRIVHGVGTFVAEGGGRNNKSLVSMLLLDHSTVPELFEARRAFETATAALAAKRRTTADVSALRQILAELDDDTLSSSAYVQLDVKLHSAIAAASHNRILIGFTEDIKEAFAEYSQRVINLVGRRDNATSGHRAIVDAILAGRQGAARHAMFKHLEEAERDVLLSLQRQKSGAVKPGASSPGARGGAAEPAASSRTAKSGAAPRGAVSEVGA